MYSIFKDSPAQCADYIALTGCTVFPVKFCQIRWIENVRVAERALEVLPNVKKFAEDAKKLPSTITHAIIKLIMQIVQR